MSAVVFVLVFVFLLVSRLVGHHHLVSIAKTKKRRRKKLPRHHDLILIQVDSLFFLIFCCCRGRCFFFFHYDVNIMASNVQIWISHSYIFFLLSRIFVFYTNYIYLYFCRHLFYYVLVDVDINVYCMLFVVGTKKTNSHAKILIFFLFLLSISVRFVLFFFGSCCYCRCCSFSSRHFCVCVCCLFAAVASYDGNLSLQVCIQSRLSRFNRLPDASYQKWC